MKKHNALQNWVMAVILISTIACAFSTDLIFLLKLIKKKKYGIPTSLQWKGLVPPVVQLYTMIFLGLEGKEAKEHIRRPKKTHKTYQKPYLKLPLPSPLFT